MKIWMFLLAPSLASAQGQAHPQRFERRAGLLYYADLLPLPVLSASFEFKDGFVAEATAGTLLVAGGLDLGVHYRFYQDFEQGAYVGLHAGANYKITDSALYGAASLGIKHKEYCGELGPAWYYRRDFEDSHTNEGKVTVFLRLMRELPFSLSLL